MKKSALAWTIFRVLLGLFFIYVPIMIFIAFGGDHPPEAAPAAAAFTGALNASGFMNPLLSIDLMLGGMALLFHRTAPLGIVLLAPPVVVIGFFHWMLTHNVVWGTVWPVALALLAWRYRHVLARLWEAQPNQ